MSKSFAVIENNIVTNIIVAETKEVAETATGKICVEYTDLNPACIGLGYDGTTFEQPPVILDTPTE
jgi:hypothetical protein